MLAAAASAPVQAARSAGHSAVEEVIVVYKTHFDIGFTDLARNVVASYRTGMIDKALDIVERTRDLPPEARFVWTIPGWPMARILRAGQDRERRRRVIEAHRGVAGGVLRPGAFEVVSTPLTALPRPFLLKIDTPPEHGTVAKQTGVHARRCEARHPGHSDTQT